MRLEAGIPGPFFSIYPDASLGLLAEILLKRAFETWRNSKRYTFSLFAMRRAGVTVGRTRGFNAGSPGAEMVCGVPAAAPQGGGSGNALKPPVVCNRRLISGRALPAALERHPFGGDVGIRGFGQRIFAADAEVAQHPVRHFRELTALPLELVFQGFAPRPAADLPQQAVKVAPSAVSAA